VLSPLRAKLASLALALLACAAVPVAAHAQAAQWLPRLQLDNDAYNFWIQPADRTDEQYSNGVELTMATLSAPWWGSRFFPGTPACADSTARTGRCLATTLALAQDIYTPNLAHPPFSEPDWQSERPYAAWLRVTGGTRVISAREERVTELAVGVTGGPALGQPAQSFFHHLASAYTTKALGWETQVGFEPGIVASYRETLLAASGRLFGIGAFDLTPFAGASLGNVLTQGDVGAKARVGLNLSHPWDPRAWTGRPSWELYLSGGARREYVARDFSLDGTLFDRGRHVERIPGVTEYEGGLGLRVYRLSLAYRAVTRGREYTTGPAHHTFSSMIATLEFAR
jgi:hypothetical protein